jgi:hypothetical protein
MAVPPQCTTKGRYHSFIRLRHNGQIVFEPVQKVSAYFVVMASTGNFGNTGFGVLAVIKPDAVREIDRCSQIKLRQEGLILIHLPRAQKMLLEAAYRGDNVSSQ